MKLFLDEDLHPGIAKIGRGLELDIVSVHEVDRRGATDEAQLRFAISQDRALVTRNRNDFLRLAVTFFQTGVVYPGILIVPHSLPNHRPEQIAHALVGWCGRLKSRDPGACFVDFL